MDDLHLPKYVSLLTPAQKIGVFYGDHIARPVPRAEAEEIAVRAPALFFFHSPHDAYHYKRLSFATISLRTLRYTLQGHSESLEFISNFVLFFI